MRWVCLGLGKFRAGGFCNAAHLPRRAGHPPTHANSHPIVAGRKASLKVAANLVITPVIPVACTQLQL